MSGLQAGFDTADYLDRVASIYGNTTNADFLFNRMFAGISHRPYKFAGRYLLYDAGNVYKGDSEAIALARAARASGTSQAFIVPIDSPNERSNGGTTSSSRNNAAFNFGLARGRKICRTIIGRLSSHLRMPGSGRLHVFLDLEGTEVITPEYWYGWAQGVNTYRYGGYMVPFFACAYIGAVGEGQGAGTGNGDKNANIIAAAAKRSPDYKCFGTWLTGPNSTSAYCTNPEPPSWGPLGSPPPYFTAAARLPTFLWQYTESDPMRRTLGCGPYKGNYQGDADSTSPFASGPFNNDMTDYMLSASA